MDPFERVQLVVAVALGVLVGLRAAARRWPGVTWLRSFDFPLPRRSPAEAARSRRTADVLAGIQLILLGLALPAGYLILTLMMFSEPDPLWLGGTIVGALLLVALGVMAIIRRGR